MAKVTNLSGGKQGTQLCLLPPLSWESAEGNLSTGRRGGPSVTLHNGAEHPGRWARPARLAAQPPGYSRSSSLVPTPLRA